MDVSITKQNLYLNIIDLNNYLGKTIINLKNSSNKIILNCSNNLIILDVTVNDNPIKYQHQNNQLMINCCILFKTIITIVFSGKLNNHYQGMFCCDNQILTLFQPDLASSVFPCFESFHHVGFQLSLTLPKKYLAKSNTSLLEVIELDDQITYNFLPTIPLPIYVIGWYIYPNNIKFYTSKVQINNRILTINSNHNYQELFNITHLTINYLETILEKDFPSDKLDFIFVPILQNTGSIGMENHGLIILSQEIYQNRGYQEDYHKIVTTIVHEIIHHYFGNLVTCQDWNHLWFNEGVTTWLSYKIIDHLFPELNIYQHVFLSYRSIIFDYDNSPKTHPIITNDGQANFDTLTYDKTSQLLCQLDYYFGNLLDILRRILIDHKTINFDQFISYFQLEYQSIITSWFLTPRIPILSIIKNQLKTNGVTLPVYSTDNQMYIAKRIKSDSKKNTQWIYSSNCYYLILTDDLSNIITKTIIDQTSLLQGLIYLGYNRYYPLETIYLYIKTTVDRYYDPIYLQISFQWIDTILSIVQNKQHKLITEIKLFLFQQLDQLIKFITSNIDKKSNIDSNNELMQNILFYYGGKYQHQCTFQLAEKYYQRKLVGSNNENLRFCLICNYDQLQTEQLLKFPEFRSTLMATSHSSIISKIVLNCQLTSSYNWIKFINIKYLEDWSNSDENHYLFKILNQLPNVAVSHFLIKRCNSISMVNKIQQQYPEINLNPIRQIINTINSSFII